MSQNGEDLHRSTPPHEDCGSGVAHGGLWLSSSCRQITDHDVPDVYVQSRHTDFDDPPQYGDSLRDYQVPVWQI